MPFATGSSNGSVATIRGNAVAVSRSMTEPAQAVRTYWISIPSLPPIAARSTVISEPALR